MAWVVATVDLQVVPVVVVELVEAVVMVVAMCEQLCGPGTESGEEVHFSVAWKSSELEMVV